ncbi:AraC family transcriptional regulator [Kocuria varians]
MVNVSERLPSPLGDPVHELVVMDSVSALRWFRHDVPHPLARWHHHPEVEIHLITASTGTAQIGDAVQAFSPGALYLIGSGLPHNWVSSLRPGETVPGRDVLLQFHPDLVTDLARQVPDLGSLPILLDEARRGIEFTGATRDQAEEALLRIRGSREIRRFALFLELLDVLARAPRKNRRTISQHVMDAPLDTAESDLYNAALVYLHARLTERFTLSDVAEHLAVSPSHLSRLFTRATGVGYSRTVTRLRVFEACRLLRHTETPIGQVCFRSGFGNQSNFNRRFHEETGMTPHEYRSGVMAG